METGDNLPYRRLEHSLKVLYNVSEDVGEDIGEDIGEAEKVEEVGDASSEARKSKEIKIQHFEKLFRYKFPIGKPGNCNLDRRI